MQIEVEAEHADAWSVRDGHRTYTVPKPASKDYSVPGLVPVTLEVIEPALLVGKDHSEELAEHIPWTLTHRLEWVVEGIYVLRRGELNTHRRDSPRLGIAHAYVSRADDLDRLITPSMSHAHALQNLQGIITHQWEGVTASHRAVRDILENYENTYVSRVERALGR